MQILFGQTQVYESDPQKGIAELLSSINRQTTEIFHHTYATFGIDDAHTIRALLSHSALLDGKIFLIGLYAATLEAQNALLKIFEELPAGNSVVIVIPEKERLLPTLVSRLVLIGESTERAKGILAEKFATHHPANRLAMLKPYVVHADDDDEKAAKLEEIRIFLNDLEKMLYARGEFKKSPALAETIFDFKRQLRGTAPSVRLMLEHLALYTPVVSSK